MQAAQHQSPYEDRRQHVLKQIQLGVTDKSPKGFIDDPIYDLITYINSLDGIYTTSSCSGRITVFEEGAQSKGGRWLLADHCEAPPDIVFKAVRTVLASPEERLLFARNGDSSTMPTPAAESAPSDAAASDHEPSEAAVEADAEGALEAKSADSLRHVHLRFEAFILAVEARTLELASAFLTVAHECGYRDSGITAVAKRFIVNVRGALRLDAPVVADRRALVSPAYLQHLTELCNAKMRLNVARVARFFAAVRKVFPVPPGLRTIVGSAGMLVVVRDDASEPAAEAKGASAAGSALGSPAPAAAEGFALDEAAASLPEPLALVVLRARTKFAKDRLWARAWVPRHTVVRAASAARIEGLLAAPAARVLGGTAAGSPADFLREACAADFAVLPLTLDGSRALLRALARTLATASGSVDTGSVDTGGARTLAADLVRLLGQGAAAALPETLFDLALPAGAAAEGADAAEAAEPEGDGAAAPAGAAVLQQAGPSKRALAKRAVPKFGSMSASSTATASGGVAADAAAGTSQAVGNGYVFIAADALLPRLAAPAPLPGTAASASPAAVVDPSLRHMSPLQVAQAAVSGVLARHGLRVSMPLHSRCVSALPTRFERLGAAVLLPASALQGEPWDSVLSGRIADLAAAGAAFVGHVVPSSSATAAAAAAACAPSRVPLTELLAALATALRAEVLLLQQPVHTDFLRASRAFVVHRASPAAPTGAASSASTAATPSPATRCGSCAGPSCFCGDGLLEPALESADAAEGGCWVRHRESGLTYALDVTRSMFSSGNFTEKARGAALGRAGETVLDLYAGIGYFTLPYLCRAKVAHVYALELNPHSITALRRGLRANGAADRCTVIPGDNRRPALRTLLRGVADRVNLGLIPSSRDGWPLALDALGARGGWLHVHANVDKGAERAWAEASLLPELAALLREVAASSQDDEKAVAGPDLLPYTARADASSTADGVAYYGRLTGHAGRAPLDLSPGAGAVAAARELCAGKAAWTLRLAHVEVVKSYSPRVVHAVFDVWAGPPADAPAAEHAAAS